MAARGERQPDRAAAASAATGTTLHGRDSESAQIRALIDAARAGRGGVLVVEGEPGSGKTALVDAVTAGAAADGCTVLRAHGIDSGAELAFSGLTELLAPLAESVAKLAPEQREVLAAALLAGVPQVAAMRGGRQGDGLHGGPAQSSIPQPAADPVAAADGTSASPAALISSFSPIPQPRAAAQPPATSAAASPSPLLLGTAVFSLLTAAANPANPLLLWIDDIHWLDGSSLSVLTFVARRVTGLPIALIATRRGPEPAFGPRDAATIRLTGLDEPAARRLLAEHGAQHDSDRADGAAATGRPGRDRWRRHHGLRLGAEEFDRLLAETRGNPLALIEMFRLAASGALDLATLVGGREPLPSGVQLAGLYHDEVVTLPDRTRSALITVSASFTGEAAPITAALAAAGLDPADLTPAEHRGLVELAAGQIRFHHPLLRSAVYHGASDEAVRDAHRRLAVALGGGDGPAAREQHAWHRSYAVEGPDPDAARELAGAAAAAARRGALTAARQAYQRAATIAPTAASYLIEAAVCARIEGDADEALALLDAAEQELAALEPDDFFDFFDAARAVEGDGAAEEGAFGVAGGVAATPDGAMAVGSGTDASADASAHAASSASHDAHAAAADSVRDADPDPGPAEASQPHPTPALLDLVKARIEAERARVELSRAEPGRLMTDLVTAATSSTDRRHAVTLTLAAAAAGVLGAHYREAREIASQALAHALDQHTRAAAAALSGHITLLLGDRDAARELTDAALAAFDPEDVDVPIEAVVFAAWSRTLMRDWSPATHQLLDKAVRAAHDAGALSRLPPLLAVAAELNQRAGHWDVALTRAQECIDLGVELGQGMSPGLGIAVAARVAAYRGDRAAFADLQQRAATLPALRDDHPVRLALRHAEAVLRLDDAPDQAAAGLRAVQEALDNLGIRHPDFVPIRADLDEALDRPHEPADEPESDPFLMARRALRQAVALRERRHHAEARSLLEPAREIFRRLQAHRWDARCAAELARLGGPEPAADPGKDPAPATLTQYETQVARKVGAGATNNETAAALFISPKTVEYHLRNLYRKLGIRSRTELARIVAGWDEGQD